MNFTYRSTSLSKEWKRDTASSSAAVCRRCRQVLCEKGVWVLKTRMKYERRTGGMGKKRLLATIIKRVRGVNFLFNFTLIGIR